MPSSKTHTAIASLSLKHFDAVQVPTPVPGEGQVLIKVAYAAMIAFDTYINDLGYHATFPMIFGFNASGTVAEVGPGIDDLQVGDKVTAFTFRNSEAKGMQEYTLQTRSVVAKVPDFVSLEAAAAVPDNFITAFNSLFNPEYLGLPYPISFPAPESPPLADVPILIYGAGSTTGHYAVQLLHSAGYKNIIVTASPKHHEYLRSLGATHTFDYNSPTLIEDINSVVTTSKIGKLELVLDCITAQTTLAAISKVVSSQGTVAVLLPLKMGSNVRSNEDDTMWLEIPDSLNPFPTGTRLAGVRTFLFEEVPYLKDNLMTRILPSLLEKKVIEPTKIRLLDEAYGPLKDRVEVGLDLLRNNKVSGEKVIVKVS
ncbi:chaperonin 10-like protein [Lentinula detonsa]|uniref:Chaperonin 10-like protein n=1 Tax=Lentinula detonsa TaxID=2804962 RepID=A0AA38Q809_9AGAR|nr:chaperonin 10-like protein [Lentinula detonsa]